MVFNQCNKLNLFVFFLISYEKEEEEKKKEIVC